MKYKVLKNLQFYYQENVIVVQINEKHIKNREHIFDIEETMPYFLEVDEIITKDGKLEIVYNRPSGYTSLIDFKDYADFYKLDIVNRLLEMTALSNVNTYLAMQNILLKDTRNLLFIYKADQYNNLPFCNLEPLEQWKNFIASFFGRYTLEKYEKNRTEILAKEKNEFLNEVEKVSSLDELHQLIKRKLTDEQRNFFSQELKDKQLTLKESRRKKIIKVSLGIAVIALYIGTVGYMKFSEQKKVLATQQNAEAEITILNKIIDDDSQNIEKDMRRLNYPKHKQVDIYVKLGDYDKAYALDKNADKKIMRSLYKQNKIAAIKKLKMPSSEYLSDFKQILSYESSSDVDYLLQTSTDSYLIEVLIDQVVDKKDIQTAKNIYQISIEQKDLAIDSEHTINLLDLLIADNNSKLEDVYKNTNLNEEDKKKETNELLEENNSLLNKKFELQKK